MASPKPPNGPKDIRWMSQGDGSANQAIRATEERKREFIAASATGPTGTTSIDEATRVRTGPIGAPPVQYISTLLPGAIAAGRTGLLGPEASVVARALAEATADDIGGSKDSQPTGSPSFPKTVALEGHIETPGLKRRKTTVRAKTTLGRFVLANSADIALNAAAMMALIDGEIERLQGQRPNDRESEAGIKSAISNLQAVKKGVAVLQKAVVDFKAGNVQEGNLLKFVKAFGRPFADLWKAEGQKYLGYSATISIICVGTILGRSVGMPDALAATVVGAVCAHNELAKVLKASKGVFKFFGDG